MSFSLSTQGIVNGAFGTFTSGMAVSSAGAYHPAVALLTNLSGSGALFDPATLMPATGGTVSLVAGSAAIGSIIGRTSNPSITPTITAGAYTAGFEIGGLMTFAVGGAGSGILESITVTCKSVQTTSLYLNIFDVNPTSSTWTDHTAPAINSADTFSLMASYLLGSPYSGLGTHTVWSLDAIGASFVGPNLYGVLVAVSTPTFASTTDIRVKLGIVDD